MSDYHPQPSSSVAPDLPPLHTQNPLQRFSNRADDYAKYRPSYPAAAIDQILQDLGQPSSLVAADIGAGTGISSRLVADRGVKVLAVEPNTAMQAAAEPHAQVEFLSGTAENTGLPDQSVDLVFCCQAFHWFEPNVALQEFHRILKPDGRVALMWNDRDRDDELTEQYTEALRKAIDERYLERLDRKASTAESLQHSSLFKNYSAYVFVNAHPLDRAGLVGIALSASYVPKTGAKYEQLVLDLQHLYDRWLQRGSVALSYRTNLFLAHARG